MIEKPFKNEEMEKKLGELFSAKNYQDLFETYCLFGKESADLMFKEQVEKTFSELVKNYE